MFQTFIEPLELELDIKSTHAMGRVHQNADTDEYKNRIEAINFSLAHDDGQSNRNLSDADVILVGVSRSGKTPTSLYLAMQYGVKAANYPLIPEDFERGRLPTPLLPYKEKMFGLSIDPQRLAEIRNERRPGSKRRRSGWNGHRITDIGWHDKKPFSTFVENGFFTNSCRGYPRCCRHCSKMQTAAAAATFSDSIPPG